MIVLGVCTAAVGVRAVTASSIDRADYGTDAVAAAEVLDCVLWWSRIRSTAAARREQACG